MKAFFILLAFALTGSCLAVQMYAVGLDNPGEQWSWFDMNSAEFKLESSFGFSTHTVTVEYKMIPDSWGRYPSGQPFQIVFLINPSDQAIFTGAAVRIDREWVIAEAEDVFAAEEHYDENVQDQPSFLMRDKVRREWDGSERRYVEIRLGPVYYPKSFAFSLTYIDQNQLDINAFLAVFPVSQFNLYRDTSLRMNLLFRDADYPENRPVSLRSYSGNDLVFTKNSSGWWEAKLPSRDGWGDDPLIRWPRPFPLTPELRLFESDGHSFFHLLMLPPLKPADRPTKKVLLLYDLGVKIAHDRGTLFSALQSTAELGLADSDSINVLLMDNLEPVLFYPDFVTATDANIQSLFRRLKDAVIPEISGLPQLLRSAKDYFNKKNTAGELWVFTDAAEHCKAVSGANDILDLSWAKLEVPVEFNIFDCSTYSSDYLTLNGRTYNGNEYLYENLARLSGGGIVKSLKFTWYQLPRALAEVFMPALDVVESSPNPTGGYYFNRYDLNQGRTHYPIAVPKMEIGRYIGNSPFTIEFFGQVDDELFRSSLIQDENGNEEHQEDIEVIWNGHYVLDLLKQPQSHTLITQIGELSKREKILSPYCGFVAPSMNGYQGFQRLTQIASAVEETIAAESVPESFAPIAFPNPFNAQTTLKIEIRPAPNNRLAQFEIIDVLGRIVKHVEIPLSADEDEITFVWDGQDSGGVPVSTGIYFVRCLLGNQQSLIKLTLVK